MTIEELNRKFGTDGAVKFSVGEGGLPMCTLTTPAAKTAVYLHGAHVVSYEPAGEKPVIYMSPRSNFATGKPIRGGVPLCLPWFGPKSDDPKAPAHGFVRLSEWKVIDVIRSGNAVTLSLRFDTNEETRKLWPFDLEAVMRVTLGDTLKLQLEVINRSDKPIEITDALHTYFSVSDARQVTVSGLEKDRFSDKAAGIDYPPAGKPIQFEGETDRVYFDTAATCVIHDSAWSRKIEVSKTGSKSTVVWNPHVKKATALADLGEDTWPHFVCVETANALSNFVIIKPGDVHIMSQTIRVLKG